LPNEPNTSDAIIKKTVDIPQEVKDALRHFRLKKGGGGAIVIKINRAKLLMEVEELEGCDDDNSIEKLAEGEVKSNCSQGNLLISPFTGRRVARKFAKICCAFL